MRNTSILSRPIANGNIRLTPGEISAYCRARLPKMPQRGRQWRSKCPIHRGDGLNFSVDPAAGCWYCHSQCGRGGDLIGLEMALTSATFRQACRAVGEIVGRDLLTDRPRRPRYSPDDLRRAEKFALGLRWRLDRAVTVFKSRLWTSAHSWAVPRVRRLTEFEQQMQQWSIYDALRVMRVMNKRIVQECVTEAQEFHHLIQHAAGSEERAA